MVENDSACFVQVKEVIMAYFVLMSQGKATDLVSDESREPTGGMLVRVWLVGIR